MSRHQILQWINHVTNAQLTKLQQLGSGNIYCQILDAAYPEKVPLLKVKWNAYLEVDFLYNFKILQTSFQKIGIKKTIDTQKLVKAKYQDNLQFIQWMKKTLQQKIKLNDSYNALQRRGFNQIYLLFSDKKPAEIKNFSTIYQKQSKDKAQKQSKTKEDTQLIIDIKKWSSNNAKTQRPMNLTQKDKTFAKNLEYLGRTNVKVQAQKQNIKQQQIQRVKKVKKSKLEVITKPKQFLGQKKINQNIEQQQCF